MTTNPKLKGKLKPPGYALYHCWKPWPQMLKQELKFLCQNSCEARLLHREELREARTRVLAMGLEVLSSTFYQIGQGWCPRVRNEEGQIVVELPGRMWQWRRRDPSNNQSADGDGRRRELSWGQGFAGQPYPLPPVNGWMDVVQPWWMILLSLINLNQP